MELKNFFVQDDQGNKLPGAQCYLYQRGTESPATGAVKANGGPLGFPFMADNDGLVQLAAPNGLYDLRVTSSGRDYRIRLQFNDVSDSLESAQAAVQQAEVARDAAQLSAGVKDDIAQGLATTVSGQYFSVPSSSSGEYLILYKNNAGVALPIDSYPNTDIVGLQLKPDFLRSYVEQDQAGYTPLDIAPDGTIRISLAELQQVLAVTLRSVVSVVQDRAGSDVARTSTSRINIPSVLDSLEDALRYSAFQMQSDGTVAIPVAQIETLNATVIKAATQQVRQLQVIDRAGTILTQEGGAGNVPGHLTSDSAGSCAISLFDREVRIGNEAQMLLSMRGREAAAGNWFVFSRRRANSLNHDLYSTNMNGGKETKLTEDATDTFDFASPVISGSTCLYKRFSGESVSRFAVPLSGPASALAPLFPAKKLHLLGDSFVSKNLGDQLQAASYPVRVTSDGVGGSTLHEQMCRLLGGTSASPDSNPGVTYPGTPERLRDIFLLLDDTAPFSDSPADIATFLGYYAQIIAGMKPYFKRFLILECGVPGGGVGGSAGRAARDNKWNAIVSAYPDNVVPVFAAMQASSDGSALDQQFVAANLWPASCYGDPGTPSAPVNWHPSAKANGIYVQQVLNTLTAKGWL